MHRKNFIWKIVIAINIIFIYCIYLQYMLPSREHHVFGVTYMTMNNPFYKIINNEILKVVEKHGDILITLDPALDIEKQNEQIYDMVDKDVDGIFVNPIDFKKNTPALQAAKEAGIPIIIIDSPVQDSELVNCTVVSDNYDAGVQCAREMMERVPSANIILLKHTTAQSAKERIDGFCAAIAGNNNYKIVNESECEGQLEKAMPAVQRMLEETPQVNVIMALNDPSALGAIAALEEKQRYDVLVYGVDGTPDMKSLFVYNPAAAGTVAQSPISIGKIAGEKMYEILAGENVEKKVIIPVFFINKDNLSGYDEKGWQ